MAFHNILNLIMTCGLSIRVHLTFFRLNSYTYIINTCGNLDKLVGSLIILEFETSRR